MRAKHKTDIIVVDWVIEESVIVTTFKCEECEFISENKNDLKIHKSDYMEILLLKIIANPKAWQKPKPNPGRLVL